ncbi:hypothetical protein TKK_0019162 [Trichogramma kaykai]
MTQALSILLRDTSIFPGTGHSDHFLRCALKKKTLKIVVLLVANHYEIHQNLFEDGKSALHYLAELDGSEERYNVEDGKTMELIKFFLNNADTNHCDAQGYTYFHGACMAGDVAALNLFLSHGADVNLTSYKHSPLHIAAQYRNAEIVEILLERGAYPNVEDQERSTPLHSLARVCLCECVGFYQFCDRRKPVDDIVRMLVEKEANIEALDCRGDTPLQCAVSRFDPQLTKSLLNHGATLKSLNKNRMFSMKFDTFEFKNYPLTLNIIQVMSVLQSFGYEISLYTRFRMLKCWLRVRGGDIDHMCADAPTDKDKKKFFQKIRENSTIYEKFEFFMEETVSDYLFGQFNHLIWSLPEYSFVYDLNASTMEKLKLEALQLKNIKLNEDVSLFQLCRMNFEKGYAIIKEIKDWQVPELHDLKYMKLIVKRHIANILIRPHMELFVTDLLSTGFINLNKHLPYNVCQTIAEKMKNKDLLFLCKKTNKRQLTYSHPKRQSKRRCVRPQFYQA